MKKQKLIIKKRLAWFEAYETERSVPAVCKKFSISKKTFYKWWKRYKSSGYNPQSLADESRRPHHTPTATPPHIIERTKELRMKTGFGQKRIQLYLAFWHNYDIAEYTIWNLLKKSGIDMSAKKSLRRNVKPDEPLLPGDRVVLFSKKITHPIDGKHYIHYSAVDECTHLLISKIYDRHSTLSVLDFIQFILMKFPFHIQYMRTPIDAVFTSVTKPGLKTHAFTKNLQRLGIRHQLPTRQQEQTKTYRGRLRRYDPAEPYLSKQFATLVELENEMQTFVSRYNNEMPKLLIEKMTPAQKLSTFTPHT